MRRLLAALSVVAAVAGFAVVPSAAAAEPTATQAGGYVPVGPTRLLDGVTVGGHGTRNVQVTGLSGEPDTGIGAVALTISVTVAAQTGSLVAFAAGATEPDTVNVQFGPGRRTSDTAVVVPGADGDVSLHNNSGGTIRIYVDLSGCYLAGASSAAKSYHPVKATRLYDGITIAAGKQANPVLGGHGPLPGSDIGAVAITLTERSASKYGALGAKAYGLPITGTKVLHWKAGQRVSTFAIVPVDADGQITFTNYSAASVDIAVDVVGYFLQGAPDQAGLLNTVPAAYVTSNVQIPQDSEADPLVASRVGVPYHQANLRAVLVTITVTSSVSTTGSMIAGPYHDASPTTASVQFGPNETVSATAIVPARNSHLSVYNHSNGPVLLSVAVTGWILDSDLTPPKASVGRYVRNLERGKSAANAATMAAEGTADAGSALVLLDIGAQRNDKTGVQLTNTDDEAHHIDYDGLVAALDSYVAAYAAAGGAGDVLIGTSNSADDWTHYTAGQRGRAWWSQVVSQITVPPGVGVVGASDMEPGFGTGKISDALKWKAAYQATNEVHPFVFNGSADGCPVDFGRPDEACANGWTERDLVALAGGPNTEALPQVYNSRQAIQWANIYLTHELISGFFDFLGALTENAVDGSYPADQGWAALHNALAAVNPQAPLPAVVALQVDD